MSLANGSSATAPRHFLDLSAVAPGDATMSG